MIMYKNFLNRLFNQN